MNPDVAFDLIRSACGQQFSPASLPLLAKKKVRHSAYSFTTHSVAKPSSLLFDETAVLLYTAPQIESEGKIQLRFCVSGSRYCSGKVCGECTINPNRNCISKQETLELIAVDFETSRLPKTEEKNITLATQILDFTYSRDLERSLSVCGKTRTVLDAINVGNYDGSFEKLHLFAQLQLLLAYSLDCMIGETETALPVCRFLSNADDRAKIVSAKEILLAHIGDPITIKELSRKVAINECYLKKGFKEIFGTTIFEFYREKRMAHAKYLLDEKGVSVTEVSDLLGYSSISHFSTAFKKFTGIKPCELLR